MKISSISFAQLSFERKKKRKVTNPQVKQTAKNKGGGQKIDENYEKSYFKQKILSDILKEDPEFKYNKDVAIELSKLGKEKLEILNIKGIKASLQTKDKEKALSGIQIVNEFEPTEIKEIIRLGGMSKTDIYRLLEGIVPKCAQDDLAARLRYQLITDK